MNLKNRLWLGDPRGWGVCCLSVISALGLLWSWDRFLPVFRQCNEGLEPSFSNDISRAALWQRSPLLQ